jgi:hypothetical protein
MRGGPGSSFGVLLAKLNLFSSAEALDRSDAIAQIDSKLRKIINVAVRIDEAGNNRPAGGVDFVNAAREFDFRADGFDSTVSDEQRRVLDRGTAGAVDNASPDPGLTGRGCRWLIGRTRSNYSEENKTKGRCDARESLNPLLARHAGIIIR